MVTGSFKGCPTIPCPDDAPVGAVGFVHRRNGDAVIVRLVNLTGPRLEFATVEEMATGRVHHVRRKSFHIQVMVCRA